MKCPLCGKELYIDCKLATCTNNKCAIGLELEDTGMAFWRRLARQVKKLKADKRKPEECVRFCETECAYTDGTCVGPCAAWKGKIK
jgi:RecB family exonuclease